MSDKTAAVIKQNGEGDFGFDVDVSGHVVKADLPEAIGGLNKAANPLDLLVASLAACTAMQVRFAANKKKFALDDVSVDVSHSKDADGTDVFERTIYLKGDLTDEQHQTLLGEANNCKVHKILSHASRVETQLAD